VYVWRAPAGDHRYPKDVRHANGGPPHALYPSMGTFAGPMLVLRGAHLKDRLTAIALAISDIREPIGRPLRRIRLRAPSPSRAEVGASRSRIGLRMSACSIATAVAIGLTALSLVLAASASATGSHGSDGAGNHSATRAGQGRADGTDGSSRPSTADRPNSIEDPSPDPDPSADPDLSADPEASEASAPGHDKCKRPKGNRPLLPWCTDPAGGWMGSTTHRVETNIANPMGICDSSSLHSSSGCRPARPAG
jgi:hypothetical protein